MFEMTTWFTAKQSLPARRRKPASPWSNSSFDDLENRALLSGVATVAPAAEVAAADSSADTVAPAAADGTWNFHTDLLDGKIKITQTGVKAKADFEYGIFKIVGKGVIRNDKLILKFKGFIGPLSAKVKLVGTLSGPDSFNGTLKGKLPIIGKFSTPINGSKV
ncbi:MAG: hypothetical protein KDA68_08135 [Planctomycetaceae bacterium]|nr:hypothetical protein [Planctomycetaceae bacterium]